MVATEARSSQLEILADVNWAMTYGDRLALEGLLSLVKPTLAIEIGTAQGGCGAVLRW